MQHDHINIHNPNYSNQAIQVIMIVRLVLHFDFVSLNDFAPMDSKKTLWMEILLNQKKSDKLQQEENKKGIEVK